MAVRDLAPGGRRSRLWRMTEIGVPLRAIGIVLIVATHAALIDVTGSAHVLIALAGYNFARFHLDARDRMSRLRGQVRTITRIVVPTVAWVVLAALFMTPAYDWKNVLLVNAVLGPQSWDASRQLWFVEVLVWILVAMVALFAIPAVDRWQRRTPLLVGVAVLGAGVIGRYELVPFDLLIPKPVLWLFAIGWLAALVTTRWQRLALSAVALASVPGFFGDVDRELVILGGLLVLIWVRRVPLPARAAGTVGVLASSSLAIYLTHWQVYPRVRETDPLLSVLASLAVGIVYWRLSSELSGRVERAVADLWRRRVTSSHERPANLERSDVRASQH